MKTITRNTSVISVSLPQSVVSKMEKTRRTKGQSRSSFIANLIEKENEDSRWQDIYAKGQETAKKFKITSEDDIDKILHVS